MLRKVYMKFLVIVLFYYEPSDGTEWLTAAAVNTSWLFSRKPWLFIVASGRSSGSTLYPAFPLVQWLVLNRVPLLQVDGFYSYGDSAGMG
jgi:hypothetical protein